jgi:hypothetical protein
VRTSSPVPKSKRERAEAPTIPPPRMSKEERAAHDLDGQVDARPSGVRARKGARPSTPAATVDEVVADLSKDPRRERDDDD